MNIVYKSSSGKVVHEIPLNNMEKLKTLDVDSLTTFLHGICFECYLMGKEGMRDEKTYHEYWSRWLKEDSN